MEQLPVRSETTKPGASSEPEIGRENQGHGASCSGVEEHRTGGRSGRRRSERSLVERHRDAIHFRGGAHAAGGGAHPSSVKETIGEYCGPAPSRPEQAADGLPTNEAKQTPFFLWLQHR